MLTRLPWPGNVRELQNVIERAAAMPAAETTQRFDGEADADLVAP